MRVFRPADDSELESALREAGEMLRAGRLVAFPTETVYGLGANALDQAAVQRIYDAKGRPARNPVIVHVADAGAARALAADWPEAASMLASAFWPGPLTIVVRRRSVVPDIVTAGRDSVGLRVPAHPVALGLLRHAGIPVAAPSANRSNRLSPTSAAHVLRDLDGRIDALLDGGPTDVGIESTVVDVTTAVPRVLRPGMITAEQIAGAVGATRAVVSSGSVDDDAPLSPGQFRKHYSPRARLVVASHEEVSRYQATAGERVGAAVFSNVAADTVRIMPRDPQGYARALYATLHELDAQCHTILVERPPNEPAWLAIIDRLTRASSRE